MNEEKQCRDMADVCELAHERTVAECAQKGIEVDCTSVMSCGDGSNLHEGDEEFEDDDTHYTAEAQVIFERHYNEICERTDM